MVYKSVVAVGFRGVEKKLYLKVKIDGLPIPKCRDCKGSKNKAICRDG